jgi:hypothetical protein
MEPTDDLTDDPATDPAEAPPSGPNEPTNDDAAPTDDPPAGSGLTRASTVLAWLALPLLVASAVLFLLPVSSPGVQQCGSPAVFLLKATSDKPLVDTSGKPLNGWNTKELRQAYRHRCSVLVARRAVPAGGLLVGFWVVAIAATLLSWATRRSLRIRARQEQRAAAYEAERVD